MSARDWLRPYPDARLAFREAKRPVFCPHTLRQNHLLAALPPEVYERLLPDLKPVSLPVGWIVHGPGESVKHLYFPTAGIVSRFYVMRSGASARLAVTGSERVVGVASFLGGESTPDQMVVLSADYAYRLGVGVVKRESTHGGPLLYSLLRYTLALTAQTAQIAVCNRHHTLQQRLCLWLLLSLYRVPGNEMSMTQDLMAMMLGVRRESITEAVGQEPLTSIDYPECGLQRQDLRCNSGRARRYLAIS
jgi:CRP-like cAMP-binding protein